MIDDDSDNTASPVATIPAFPSAPAVPEGAFATPATARGPYKRSARTRATILEAAIEVFTDKGYHASSMREIARRCEIDQSTVTHHFPTKSAMLLALMHERDEQADALIADLHPATLSDIPVAVLALARRNAELPGAIELYTLLAAESVTPDHPLKDYFHDRIVRVRTGFTEWFQRLHDAGMLRAGVTPEFAAASFFALWEGAQLHWLIDRDGTDVVALLDDHLRLLMSRD